MSMGRGGVDWERPGGEVCESRGKRSCEEEVGLCNRRGGQVRHVKGNVHQTGSGRMHTVNVGANAGEGEGRGTVGNKRMASHRRSLRLCLNGKAR